MSDKTSVILVAAGKSQRFGGKDKLFSPLLNRPLLSWTIEVFQQSDLVDEIVLVLNEENMAMGKDLIKREGFSKVSRICPGGERRQDSVKAGLSCLSPTQWVVIHDGARPCLSRDILERGLKEAKINGAAIAAVPAVDTIKVIHNGFIATTLKRDELWLAQTPQIFRYDLIVKAYEEIDKEVTDDASLVEELGYRVKVFPGSYENIKITTPQDIALAEEIICRRLNESRHRLR